MWPFILAPGIGIPLLLLLGLIGGLGRKIRVFLLLCLASCFLLLLVSIVLDATGFSWCGKAEVQGWRKRNGTVYYEASYPSCPDHCHGCGSSPWDAKEQLGWCTKGAIYDSCSGWSLMSALQPRPPRVFARADPSDESSEASVCLPSKRSATTARTRGDFSGVSARVSALSGCRHGSKAQ
jgi:hypothetical protein